MCRRRRRPVSPALRVAPRDAAVDFRQGRLLVQPARTGAALMPGRAATLLFAALRGGSESFDLPVRTIPPAVADTDIGLTIVVRISVNRLYLYDGVKLVKQYPVATGHLHARVGRDASCATHPARGGGYRTSTRFDP